MEKFADQRGMSAQMRSMIVDKSSRIFRQGGGMQPWALFEDLARQAAKEQDPELAGAFTYIAALMHNNQVGAAGVSSEAGAAHLNVVASQVRLAGGLYSLARAAAGDDAQGLNHPVARDAQEFMDTARRGSDTEQRGAMEPGVAGLNKAASITADEATILHTLSISGAGGTTRVNLADMLGHANLNFHGGQLSPLLSQMEDRGLVSITTEHAVEIVRITQNGSEALSAHFQTM